MARLLSPPRCDNTGGRASAFDFTTKGILQVGSLWPASAHAEGPLLGYA